MKFEKLVDIQPDTKLESHPQGWFRWKGGGRYLPHSPHSPLFSFYRRFKWEWWWGKKKITIDMGFILFIDVMSYFIPPPANGVADVIVWRQDFKKKEFWDKNGTTTTVGGGRCGGSSSIFLCSLIWGVIFFFLF